MINEIKVECHALSDSYVAFVEDLSYKQHTGSH